MVNQIKTDLNKILFFKLLYSVYFIILKKPSFSAQVITFYKDGC